jgi:hypothetical protein
MKKEKTETHQVPKIDPRLLTWYVHCFEYDRKNDSQTVKTYGPLPSCAEAGRLQTIHTAQGKYSAVLVNQNPVPKGF